MSDESLFREQRLQEIVAAYLQAVDAGQNPDRAKLLAQHPDLADDLRSFLVENDKMRRLVNLADAATLAPTPGLQKDEGGRMKDESISDSSRIPHPSSFPPGATVRYFGDYELLEEIARGGMGVVFKAKQVSLHRTVAVKMILKGELATPADVQRFQDEAKAAANLDHANIVPIYEIGEHDGQQYFSMKLIGPGQRKEKLGIPETVRVVALAARAVHHAHQRGILHRDIKPSNILFDENGEPSVGDFGLAKRIQGDSGTTKSVVIVGTPSYMAPEQARAEKGLTTAVDVYSLGAVLFEWLTGRPPFRGGDAMSTMMMVIADEPPRPRSLNRKIDRDLETICLKCLYKDPAKRYGSAEALADDLDRWQQGKPILARRIGRVQRVWRWCRRKPALAAVTLVALLSTFGGLAIFVTGYIAQNAAYCRSMLQTVELFRDRGRVQDARRELRRAKEYYWLGPDAEWRNAALLVAASPEVLPLGQVKIADPPRDVPLEDFHKKIWEEDKVRVEWDDADHVRISIGEDVQVRQIATGELVTAKPGETPRHMLKLTEASPKVLASMPKDAVLLGRSANDAWAVLRLLPKEVGKERIVLWDVQKRAERHVLPDVGKLPDHVLVSADGRRMAYVDPFARRYIRLWDWQAATAAAMIDMGEPLGRSQSLARLGGFSPDGEMLITRGFEGGILYDLIWQVETGKLLTRSENMGVTCQWSPDSHKLAYVSTASAARLRYLSGKQPTGSGIFLQLWELRYPSRSYVTHLPVDYATFSPADEHVAFGGHFWKIGTRGDDKVLERVEHDNGRAQFGPDGSRWLIRLSEPKDAAAGQTLEAERLGPDRLKRTLLRPAGKGDGRQMQNVEMNPDGRHALLATRRVEFRPPALPVTSDECFLEWWDLAEGKREAIWNESSPEKGVYKISLVADGRFAVTHSNGKSKLWDVAAGTVKETLPSWFEEGGYCFSPNLHHLCRFTNRELREGHSYSKPTVLDIHEVATGHLVQHLLLQDPYGGWDSTPVAFHLQAGWLAAISGAYLELWNLKTGKLWVRWLPHDRAHFSVAMSPDGQVLVTNSGDTMRLWPVPLLQQEIERLAAKAYPDGAR